MGKSEKRSIKLGLMVTVGLILFSLAIYYLGSRQNLFSSAVTVKSYFKDVNGLVEGNKVLYSGITVGSVTNIKIIDDTTILVAMSVDKDISDFIRKDSKVQINSDGLMGSKIVSIFPGSADAENIGENDFLPSQRSLGLNDVMKEARLMMEESRTMAKNLGEISSKMNNGDGDFATLVNENNITSKLNKVTDEMLEITSNANNIVERIDRGEGDLGKLINDTLVTSGAKNLLVKIDSISNKTNLMADELLQFSRNLNNGNGTLQRLVNDTVMANNIDSTIYKANNGIDNVVGAAETVENSWIFNVFSKKK